MGSEYLDNLDERIHGANEIATFRWLSRTLSVSAAVAKQMLFAFWQREKSGTNAVHAVFLLGGTKRNDQRAFELVDEQSLDDCRRSFATLTTEHIYSLQKGGAEVIRSFSFLLNLSLISICNTNVKCKCRIKAFV
jgi:DNA polymerase delta subunit 3